MNAFTFQIILWIDITEHDKMKKELDLRIAKYKIYYNECIHISNHLMDRYYGA